MGKKAAFNKLKKMGVPVLPGNNWGPRSLFEISGESNYPTVWADYWNEFDLSELDDFGVSKKINKVLDANGLYAEWINAGVLGVYEK